MINIFFLFYLWQMCQMKACALFAVEREPWEISIKSKIAWCTVITVCQDLLRCFFSCKLSTSDSMISRVSKHLSILFLDCKLHSPLRLVQSSCLWKFLLCFFHTNLHSTSSYYLYKNQLSNFSVDLFRPVVMTKFRCYSTLMLRLVQTVVSYSRI